MIDGLEVEVRDAIATVTIVRPQVANALTTEHHHALSEIFDGLDADPHVRVMILTAMGRHFCAGHDMTTIQDGERVSLPDTGFGGVTLRRSRRTPLIAAVPGAALGGGFEMVLAADLVVAAEPAFFAASEVLRGRTASSGGIQRLVRWLPWPIAMRILLTGDRIDAREAWRLGLLNEVVAVDELTERARRYARSIAAGSPRAVRAVLESARCGLERPDLFDAIAATYAAVEELRASPDPAEGARAFLEGRAPHWSPDQA